MITRPRRRLARGVWAVVAALTLVLATAGPASATSYRYWTYWHGTSTGGWTFSPVGATYRPAAGSVEGWRFAVSGTAGTTKPRMAASFSVICAGRTATGTNKLVALVVDYGMTSEAPPGESPPYSSPRTYCADVASSATAYSILLAYSSLTRSAGGLVCGIHGYPAHECGVVVTPAPAPAPQPTPKPTPKPSARPTSSTSTHSTTPAPNASSTSVTPAPSSSGAAVVAPTTPPSSNSAPPSAAAGGEATFPVAAASGAEAESTPTSGGVPLSGLAGGGLVVLLGGAALVRSRTNRRPGAE